MPSPQGHAHRRVVPKREVEALRERPRLRGLSHTPLGSNGIGSRATLYGVSVESLPAADICSRPKFGKERAHFSTRGHVFWQKGHVFFAFFCALRGSVFLWDHFFDSEGTFSGRKSALPNQNRLTLSGRCDLRDQRCENIEN